MTMKTQSFPKTADQSPGGHTNDEAMPLPPHTEWLDVVKRNVQQIRFGVVQIVVHDAKVVQIERTEKTRLDVSRTC